MIIQSYDRWVVMAEYDPGSGAVKEFTRPPKGAFVCTGHYASLSGILAVLYRSNGALWLRIGAGVRNLDQTAVSVRFHSEAEFSFLELIDGQDCDFTGTQWEKEWLADGKVCHCIACVAARKCISDIKLMEGSGK